MSVRVVARVRPLLRNELDKSVIVETASSSDSAKQPTIIRIPNPKNSAESYSFNFNSVYDQRASQQDLFDNEGAHFTPLKLEDAQDHANIAT